MPKYRASITYKVESRVQFSADNLQDAEAHADCFSLDDVHVESEEITHISVVELPKRTDFVASQRTEASDEAGD